MSYLSILGKLKTKEEIQESRKPRKCKVTGKILPMYFAGMTKPEHDEIMREQTMAEISKYERKHRQDNNHEAGIKITK